MGSKPRYAAKVDQVQPAIVADLRDRGAKVLVLDVSEDGAPDLAVLWCGSVTLLELKSRGRKPDAEQLHWHDEARRRGVLVHVVTTPAEARAAVGMGEGERQRANLAAMAALAGEATSATDTAHPACGDE